MISKAIKKKIDKQDHLGFAAHCPVCNSTLKVKRKFYPARKDGGKIVGRDVTVTAKCYNCNNYGEYTYDELNLK